MLAMNKRSGRSGSDSSRLVMLPASSRISFAGFRFITRSHGAFQLVASTQEDLGMSCMAE